MPPVALGMRSAVFQHDSTSSGIDLKRNSTKAILLAKPLAGDARHGVTVVPLESRPPLPTPPASARQFIDAQIGRIVSSDDESRRAAIEQLTAEVYAGLARWFGPYGSTALILRSIAQVQARHTALAGVTFSADATPHLVGVAETAKANGDAAVSDGLGALLGEVGDLVARLIGDDLAINVLQQGMSLAAARSSAHSRTGGVGVAHQPNTKQ